MKFYIFLVLMKKLSYILSRLMGTVILFFCGYTSLERGLCFLRLKV